MTTDQIGFIGGGNMAQALIAALLTDRFEAQYIAVSEPNVHAQDTLKALGIRVYDSAGDWLTSCDIVVLAVKPQILPQVLLDCASYLQNQLVISIAAGVSSHTLRQLLPTNPRIIRAMPNTPALVQQGATGLFADTSVAATDQALAEQVLGLCGRVVWITDESLMDVVTAVSGSGPAYFFYLIEHMVCAAKVQGLDEQTARLLATQTCLGAAHMLLQATDSPKVLRERVTSPNGTTEAAINCFDAQHMGQIIQAAIAAAAQRSNELMMQMDQTAAALAVNQRKIP